MCWLVRGDGRKAHAASACGLTTTARQPLAVELGEVGVGRVPVCVLPLGLSTRDLACAAMWGRIQKSSPSRPAGVSPPPPLPE